MGVKGRIFAWERSRGSGKEGQTRGDHREKEKDMCPMWKDFMRM